MNKVAEFRRNAAECRALAARMELGAQRDQLLRMAATWEELANDREAQARRDGDPAPAGPGPNAPRRLDS